MDDSKIVQLYFDRSETAIAETDRKYGPYCHTIAYNILANNEDAQECVSDTYLTAWNAMPPRRPSILSTFLGKITRRLSIDRWRTRTAYKRGGGEIPLALDELSECVSGGETPEQTLLRRQMALRFNQFLQSLPEVERCVFLSRYWYLDSVANIAEHFGFTESKVKSMLHRTRGKLRTCLQKEGWA